MAAFTTKRASHRASMQNSLAVSRAEKAKRLTRDDAVHAALIKRKEDVEKEELRVELALSEKASRYLPDHSKYSVLLCPEITPGVGIAKHMMLSSLPAYACA